MFKCVMQTTTLYEKQVSIILTYFHVAEIMSSNQLHQFSNQPAKRLLNWQARLEWTKCTTQRCSPMFPYYCKLLLCVFMTNLGQFAMKPVWHAVPSAGHIQKNAAPSWRLFGRGGPNS